MAVMSDADRREAWALLMQDWSDKRQNIPMTKDVLRAAINAIDQWIDDQATSFNNALPLAVRQALTPDQKIDLFMFVLTRRRVVQ